MLLVDSLNADNNAEKRNKTTIVTLSRGTSFTGFNAGGDNNLLG